MGKYSFIQHRLRFEIQNNFLKPFILFSSSLLFSLLQYVNGIISQILIQPYANRITQLLATQYDCSKQNILRQFIVTRLHKCNRAPSEIEQTRIFASVFDRANAKIFKVFRCSAIIQKN